MTKDESWNAWLEIWLLASPFLIGFTGLALSLYLTHRHMDAIKEALKNSRYIYLWGDYLGKRGLIWSLFEMAQIAGMILMPTLHIRHGNLDPVDVENFPPYLKRLLIIVTTLIYTAVIWLAVIYFLEKFR